MPAVPAVLAASAPPAHRGKIQAGFQGASLYPHHPPAPAMVTIHLCTYHLPPTTCHGALVPGQREHSHSHSHSLTLQSVPGSLRTGRPWKEEHASNCSLISRPLLRRYDVLMRLGTFLVGVGSWPAWFQSPDGGTDRRTEQVHEDQERKEQEGTPCLSLVAKRTASLSLSLFFCVSFFSFLFSSALVLPPAFFSFSLSCVFTARFSNDHSPQAPVIKTA